jgi:hypothetical protein
MGKMEAVTAVAIFLSARILPKSRITRSARISCTNLPRPRAPPPSAAVARTHQPRGAAREQAIERADG